MPTRRGSLNGPGSAGGLQPRLKGWLMLDGEFLMGPRYVRLLEAIDRHRSIRGACGDIRLSYRTCLNRLHRMEHVFGAPMVRSVRGGRGGGTTTLSDEARRLIRVYRRWSAAVERYYPVAFRAVLSPRSRVRR